MRRARTSLPTPRSPRISKGTLRSAHCPAARRSRIGGVLKTVWALSIVVAPILFLPLPCSSSDLSERAEWSAIRRVGKEPRRSLRSRQSIFFNARRLFPLIKCENVGVLNASSWGKLGERAISVQSASEFEAIRDVPTVNARHTVRFSDCGWRWECGYLTADDRIYFSGSSHVISASTVGTWRRIAPRTRFRAARI